MEQLAERPTARPEHAGSDPFELGALLLVSGVEAVLQDDVSRGFCLQPEKRWTMLSVPPVALSSDSVHLYLLYTIGAYIRLTFLLPLRLSLLLFSILWITSAGCLAILFDWSQDTCLYFGSRFARLFNASTGQVATFQSRENRAKAPGLAVVNHISANDIMTIYADTNDGEMAYSVTGIKHGGIIYPMEAMGAKLTPTFFMDRTSEEERKHFRKRLIEFASCPSTYPVLLFPEGFCVNSECVFQFRKAAFSGEVPVYPMAMRQYPRFGDSFWREDTYLPYLLRIMSSWALKVEIDYLPVLNKRDEESDEDFAKRVQRVVAAAIGKEAVPYDGSLKRKKEQAKFREKVQKRLWQLVAP